MTLTREPSPSSLQGSVKTISFRIRANKLRTPEMVALFESVTVMYNVLSAHLRSFGQLHRGLETLLAPSAFPSEQEAVRLDIGVTEQLHTFLHGGLPGTGPLRHWSDILDLAENARGTTMPLEITALVVSSPGWSIFGGLADVIDAIMRAIKDFAYRMRQERQFVDIHLAVARETALALRKRIRDAPVIPPNEPVDVVALAGALYKLHMLDQAGVLGKIEKYLDHYERNGLEPPEDEQEGG